MPSIIQLLPDHVANQIAAGEVVQRPASVVKELLENAIDAKAMHIKLVIKDAGKTLIQVIDDGVGMNETDARLCFERHATSKIKSAEDLFLLNTKGFRGEALASIAAIAHVDLLTKQEDEETGVAIKIEGSKVVSQEACVTAKGTSLLVKNLFFNIPARRNFLKSDNVELKHVIDEFQRVALAHPTIHFDFYNNGSELFNLPSSNYRQRIVNVLGSKSNEKLVPVDEDTEVVKVSGFVLKPQFAKKGRGEQFFFVNDRFIKSPYLHHAVNAAFEGLLKEAAQPGYFLYLDVDPAQIDINIHPTKTEIKFEDEQTIYAILRSAIKHSLGQFNVAPVLDFNIDPTMDTPYEYKNKTVSTPTIEVDASFNPFANEKPVRNTAASSGYSNGAYKSFQSPKNTASWESLYVGLDDEPQQTEVTSSMQFESEEVTGNLFHADEQEATKQSTTYQLQRKYIVTTIKSGMVIIDQNKAHQRVLYEQYLKAITVNESVSQQLIFPLELYFSTAEVNLLQTLQERLEATGFAFDSMNGEKVTINGIPMHMTESEAQIVLEQLMTDIGEDLPESGFSQTDMLAKTLAKTLAVKKGEVLAVEAQEALVNNLFACTEPTLSPFQKPTFITMTVEDIDKKFM